MATEQEAREWIADQFAKGIHPEVIKQMLAEGGWDPALFDSFLEQRARGGAAPNLPATGNFGLPSTATITSGNTTSGQGLAKEQNSLPFFETIKKVMLDPKGFFEAMPQGGGYSKPANFVLVIAIIVTILSVTVKVLGTPTAFTMVSPSTSAAMVLSWLLSGFIYRVASVFSAAVIMYPFLRLYDGKGTLEATFRVAAYSIVVDLASWIPFISIFAQIYKLYVLLIGYSKVQQISRGRATAAIISAVSVVVILVVLAAVFGLLGVYGPRTIF